MTRRLTVLVDMDGPLADLEAKLFETLGHYGGPQIDPADRRGFAAAEDYRARFGNDAAALVRTIIAEPTFYRHLPVVDGAADALEEMLAAGHEVRLCTSPYLPNPTCASDKFAWVARYLGEKWLARTIITKDKSFVFGDVLIDDKPEIKTTRAPDWQQVIFDTPSNQHQMALPRLLSWADWPDTLDTLTLEKAR